MSNYLPKIKATCAAGCLWETIHRSEFERSASIVELAVDGDFTPEVGKTYVIKNTKSTDGWGFTISQTYMNNMSMEFSDGIALPTYDKYANGIKFKYCGAEETSGIVRGIYDINGTRYTQEFDADGLDKLDNPTISGATNIYLINEDATVTVVGEKGASAYEVAVANGYEGTEEEWLASLKIDNEVIARLDAMDEAIGSAVETLSQINEGGIE